MKRLRVRGREWKGDLKNRETAQGYQFGCNLGIYGINIMILLQKACTRISAQTSKGSHAFKVWWERVSFSVARHPTAELRGSRRRRSLARTARLTCDANRKYTSSLLVPWLSPGRRLWLDLFRLAGVCFLQSLFIQFHRTSL